jgi:MFS family permease
MSRVFFPGSDPAVQALSIWGIFAVGFISRPVGALLFGHMGDTRGRGLCLLVSGARSTSSSSSCCCYCWSWFVQLSAVALVARLQHLQAHRVHPVRTCMPLVPIT